MNTSIKRKSEKQFNRGENQTHDLDVASVMLYRLSYAVSVRVTHDLDRVAQTVEHDASNIKVVSSILTAVKEFFIFSV